MRATKRIRHRPAERLIPRVRSYIYIKDSERNIIPPPSCEKISIVTDTICMHYGVLLTELRSSCRLQSLVDIRRLIYYFIIKYEPKCSMSYIGRLFNRDHSTVSVAVDGFWDLHDTNGRFRDEVALINAKIAMFVPEEINTDNNLQL